ncbi:MAG: Csu type fimbrial protein [Enterobacteriaceae bacterium]
MVASALFAPAFVSGTAVAAGTISGIFNVTLTIGSGCVVTGGTSTGVQNNFGTLSFGTYSSLTDIISGQLSGLSINCTNALAYNVSLDNGQNVTSGTQRRMSNGAGTPAYITYNLYQDAAHQTLWPSGTNLSGTGTGSATSLIVYAQVPSQTTPAAASFSDTVTMTVAW